LYAVVSASFGPSAAGGPKIEAGAVTSPGGKNVTAEPGETPTFPLITEGPVLVTVDPASTEKLVASPSPIGAAEAGIAPAMTSAPALTTVMLSVAQRR